MNSGISFGDRPAKENRRRRIANYIAQPMAGSPEND